MIPSQRERIWQVVHSIPCGNVCTYGTVAAMAGLPRHARMVGKYLSELPGDTRIPWHRVVNAQGKISFTIDSDKFTLQQQLLKNENILFYNNKIDLKLFLWQGK